MINLNWPITKKARYVSVHRIYTGPFCTFMICKIYRTFLYIGYIQKPFCTFTIYKIYRTFLYIDRIYTETFLYIYNLQNIQNLSVHRIYTETFLYIYDLQNIQNLSVHRIYTGPFCTFVGKRMLVQSLCITNLKFFILYIYLFTDFNG
jgi:hypothetical protein